MDILKKNDYISNEIKILNNDYLENVIESIEGDITIEKMYQKIFQNIDVNLYHSKDGKYYIELKKYIESMSKLKESQIINHKYSLDKDKIVKLKDLDIQESFTFHKLSPCKKLIELSGLQTLNDSIIRSNSQVNRNFLVWENLCQIIITNLPKIIESAVKKYLKNELDKINTRADEQEYDIKVLKAHNIKLEKKIEEGNDDLKNLEKRLKMENKLLKNQLDEIKKLLSVKN